MKKQRLDQLIFDLGYTESRERAKTTIMCGSVFVNGQRVDKPGTAVDPEAKIEVRGEALPFVSRGGFKLDKALKVFPVDPAGKICLDFTGCKVLNKRPGRIFLSLTVIKHDQAGTIHRRAMRCPGIHSRIAGNAYFKGISHFFKQ